MSLEGLAARRAAPTDGVVIGLDAPDDAAVVAPALAIGRRTAEQGPGGALQWALQRNATCNTAPDGVHLDLRASAKSHRS
jgi:hypothetical protein